MSDLTFYVGTGAGILTGISLLPQLIKIIKEKKAEDISLPMLFVLLTGISLWIWYGILKEDIPVMATNTLSLVINIAVLSCSIYYKRR